MLSSLDPEDTITALASPAGSARRGIVRVSGPAVMAILESVFHREDQAIPWPPRFATVFSGNFRIPGLTVPVPGTVYLWPGRRSFTGEPLAELHLPGSPPLLEAMLTGITAAGARFAKPGEFTLRAFLHGRIDLPQAEAVLGVIDARGPAELQVALAQLAGGISTRLGVVRGDLLDLLADLEAGLDFAEEHLEFVSRKELVSRLQEARAFLGKLELQAEERWQHTPRPRVVLAGPPNAGKSSLFNALVGRGAALVSAERGTTRDALHAEVLCDTLPILLCDTAGEEQAGISATLQQVAAEAQQQRQAEWDRADLIVWCTPCDGPRDLPVPQFRVPAVRVRTKSDLLAEEQRREHAVPEQGRAIAVSAQTGSGLQELRDAIVTRLESQPVEQGEILGTTAARCRQSLATAAAALDRALAVLADSANGGDEVLLSLEIRFALDGLGEILGAVFTDDILDRIFSRFCIGK